MAEKPPTKSDLLRALESLYRLESRETAQLAKAEQRAEEAVDEFLKGNKQYQKLEETLAKTRKARREHQETERKMRSQTIERLKNRVLTLGAVPGVIAEVVAACEEFGAGGLRATY